MVNAQTFGGPITWSADCTTANLPIVMALVTSIDMVRVQSPPAPPAPPTPVSPPSAASGCAGGCIGGIIGGCFVPVLMLVLYLSGAFARYGYASPFVKKEEKPVDVVMTNVKCASNVA